MSFDHCVFSFSHYEFHHPFGLCIRYSKQGIIWALVESKLRDLLQEAAIVSVANQQMTDEQAKKYFFSSKLCCITCNIHVNSIV